MNRRPRDQPTVSGQDGLRTPRRNVSTVPPREAELRLHREDARTVQIELRPETRYLIGRHEGVDVVFESNQVSRTHGALFSQNGRWHYQDMGSSNGSAVLTKEEAARGREGEPAPLNAMEAVALDIGDQVLIGGWSSRIELCMPLVLTEGGDDVDTASDVLRSRAGRDFDAKIDLAARTRVPVFLAGASGTGKTHAARQIHVRGTPEAPFILLNCARLPLDPMQLHSELLGHESGAMAGALSKKVGAFHAAHGGTLCLDEVESLAPSAQGFLLDILEGTGDPSPLGASTRAVTPAFRLIAAAKVPLSESGLRPDLCERLLEGHSWKVPSLSERREDIAVLLRRFAREQSKMLGVEVSFTEEALAFAEQAPWPGEIRQLRATVIVLAQAAVASMASVASAPSESAPKRLPILLRSEDLRRHTSERAAVLSSAPTVAAAQPSAAPTEPVKRFSRSLTKEDVAKALQRADGNQSEAARQLGIARNTLSKKMREFGLS
jgi:DNA-binding NtrC family response regulator